MTQVKNGRKFSSEFSQATVVTRETRLLAQTPNEPVENVTVGQIVDIANEGMATNADLTATNENVATNARNIQTLQNEVGNRYTKEQTDAQINEAINEVEQTIEEIEQTNKDTYATKTGEYKKLTAGFAMDLVGDGSSTEEEFSFRPTAGEDRNVANTTYYDGERNGVARIEKIKGNSVVWNQKFYVGTNYYELNGISLTEVGKNAIILNGTADNFVAFSFNTLNRKANHYYIIGALMGVETTQEWYITEQSTGRSYGGKPVIFKMAAEGDASIILCINKGVTFNNKLISIFCTDLTQMFDASNEPTTVEEFYERLPKGIDLNAHKVGKIVDGNYDKIKTVGFNAFNGTYAKVCGGCPYYLGGNYTSLGFATEEGGTTEAITLPTSTESVGTTPSDRLYTPSQNGYIYAEGTNININLSWSTEYGYLNGTYQPYQPFERDLSWVNKYFPATINGETKYGMRSAGSARDEIRFNSSTQKWEAVQRVGVVDLGDLSWDKQDRPNEAIAWRFNAKIGNSIQSGVLFNTLCEKYIFNISPIGEENVDDCIVIYNGYVYVADTSYTDVATFQAAMQGVILNYELAEPVVTEITGDVNLDFDASDYGTEELIVAEGAQSAPIVADIVYEPNAINAIKQVPDILKRLKALETAMATTTASTNVTEEE